MSGVNNNPFYLGVYGGEDCYAQLASEQLSMVKRFSLNQLEQAMKLRNLKATVRRAVQARRKRIKKKTTHYEKLLSLMPRDQYVLYECPQCRYALAALVSRHGEKSDSMIECPACEWLHHRRFTARGKITISIQETANG